MTSIILEHSRTTPGNAWGTMRCCISNQGEGKNNSNGILYKESKDNTKIILMYIIIDVSVTIFKTHDSNT